MAIKYFALDLVNEPNLIQEYEKYHENIWPEIKNSIVASGINNMEIYRTGNRLFMVMEISGTYDEKIKTENDINNPIVQEWECLMWKYQQALPWARPGEKWIELKSIFSLHSK
ncbi:L-rhamnose mutarotase [Rhizosphaericola mali]|uniref:L-rhamnose mutarotase n=1 Tax=Rhizosphaericola mali TaxID=2545455 RepID=A0A5P2G2Y0_9BACT|nr:L-rhamnose mutarotase [Rhizosphaericola mali]QES89078.1 L-rhamnose mutarotase [Rhizosphaericola mali]